MYIRSRLICRHSAVRRSCYKLAQNFPAVISGYKNSWQSGRTALVRQYISQAVKRELTFEPRVVRLISDCNEYRVHTEAECSVSSSAKKKRGYIRITLYTFNCTSDNTSYLRLFSDRINKCFFCLESSPAVNQRNGAAYFTKNRASSSAVFPPPTIATSLFL